MGIGDTRKYGYKSFVGVAEEKITYGTKTTATAFVEFNSESFKRNIEEKKIEALNTSRDFTKRILLNETVEGSLEFNLNVGSDGVVQILKQAMGGTVASAAVTQGASTITGAYIHTLYAGDMESNKATTTANDTKSLTFTVRKGGTHLWDFIGNRVNTLTIKGEVGSPVVVTAELQGKTASISSDSLTPVFSDVLPVNFTGITVKTGDSITNVSAETFIGFELTNNYNLVNDNNARALGSRTVSILPATRREVTLKLTQRFDTTTAYDRFLESTATAIQI